MSARRPSLWQTLAAFGLLLGGVAHAQETIRIAVTAGPKWRRRWPSAMA
jgi:hypothetical protein